MRYVILSDVENSGGAGIAAGRLASGLLGRGHDVYWVANRSDGRRHAWHSVPFQVSRRLSVVRGLARRGPEALRWRLHRTLVERPLRQVLDSLEPDVVNLHNVHGAGWQAAVLDAVPPGVVALWTLHDMWTLTGRCAYAYDCRQFLQGCTSSCPTPTEYPALDPRRIAEAWASRADVLRRRPAVLAVAPSRWLAREARAGLWRQHRVAHVPNGVPGDTYFPVPKATARAALRLDPQEHVVVVMAERPTERRKGWSYLRAALERVRDPRLHVLLVGETAARIDVPAPHWATAMGRVDDAVTQRLVMSAADCLVHPAPVDNLPNVVLEAMACGLPTVAFGVGGLPDMVRPGISGWLAASVTAASLAEAIEGAMASRERDRLSAACRDLATTEYGLDRQAERYEQLVTGFTSPPNPV